MSVQISILFVYDLEAKSIALSALPANIYDV